MKVLRYGIGVYLCFVHKCDFPHMHEPRFKSPLTIKQENNYVPENPLVPDCHMHLKETFGLFSQKTKKKLAIHQKQILKCNYKAMTQDESMYTKQVSCRYLLLTSEMSRLTVE